MMLVVTETILLLVRASLAAILIAAGAAKLADRHGFATTLTTLFGTDMRRERFSSALALLIPLVEILLGLAVISGIWVTWINRAVFVLMVIFTLTVLFARRKAPHATCRCFGALSDSQFNRHGLIRSVLLTIGAGMVLLWSGNTNLFQPSASSGTIFLLVVGYLIFAFGAAQAATTIALVKARIGS